MIDFWAWLLVVGLSPVAVPQEPVDLIAQYRLLVASNPDDAELWTELGTALAAAGRSSRGRSVRRMEQFTV